MGWLFVLFCIVMVIFAVVFARKANHGYTFGSGLFRNSDGNLDRDEKRDVSDFDYYNDKGKMD